MSTTTAGMLKAAEYLEAMQANVRKGIQDVDTELAVLNAAWTGSASLQFQAAMQAWKDDCQKIHDKLGQMVDMMHGNRKSIMTTEESMTEAARGVVPVGPGLNI
ncbi:WXG100 family type VII secretion target [Actinokineospora alba]|uniref:WXG100 family type VII secretion target n=1 Tax=Actinokineospora alba TaxID=504798 RepID=UPI001414D6A1|nr:WXG100 family type VII secretion target [Actinokineospora alba]